MRGVWTGGKPMGSVTRRKAKDGDVEYQFEIEKKDGTTESKSFMASEYGSDRAAFNAANGYQYERSSSQGGLRRNQYYIVSYPLNSPLSDYVIVDLSSDRDILAGKKPGAEDIMACNISSIVFVERLLWRRSAKGMAVATARVFYDIVGRRVDEDKNWADVREETVYFHRMIFTGLRDDQRVIHKDRTRLLDNRLSNLDVIDRSSYECIRVRQCCSVGKEYWRTTWREGGRLCTRSFSVNRYGDEKAKAMAQDVANAVSLRTHDICNSVLDTLVDPYTVWKKGKTAKRPRDTE